MPAALVFAASAIGAGLADLAAWYFLGMLVAIPSEDALEPLLIMAIPVTVVAGPAVGARVAGADLGAALLGSFLGAGLGVPALAVGGLPLAALVQAGATTLFVAATGGLDRQSNVGCSTDPSRTGEQALP